MTIRRYRESDRIALEKIGLRQDFRYPDSDSQFCESLWVAVDEDDVPVMAIGAFRAAHLYFWTAGDQNPRVALFTGSELMRVVREDLVYNGYNDAEGFLSPQIERTFGRHLVKHFRAIRNWASFSFKL